MKLVLVNLMAVPQSPNKLLQVTFAPSAASAIEKATVASSAPELRLYPKI